MRDIAIVFGTLWLRSAVTVLFAPLACRLLRGHPAYRYRVLRLTFAILLLWPVWTLVLPEIAILLPQRAASDGQVTTSTFLKHAAPDRAHTSLLLLLPAAVWAAGAALVGLQWLRSYRWAYRIARQGSTGTIPGWDELCRQLPGTRHPKLIVSPGTEAPFTFGVFRPKIVLPPAFNAWTASQRRIVLLHELAHVNRRDTTWQLLTQAAVALWWFQPLCFLLRSRMREASEYACDALVISEGVKPSEYAEELLRMAKTLAGKTPALTAITAIAGTGELSGRVEAILSQTKPARRTLFAAAAATLTIASMAAGIVEVNTLENRTGGIQMKHNTITGLLTSAGLLLTGGAQAATIGGSLLDPSGAPIGEAKASLYNPDTSARFETTTGANGRFRFNDLGAGPYVLEVEKPGFTSLFRAFSVKPESEVAHGFSMEPSNVAKPIRVGGDKQQEQLIRKVQPVYPPDAKAAGIQGAVVIEAHISSDGVPEELNVQSTPSDDLAKSSLDAVQQWRYRPTLLNGEPVPVVTQVNVNYTLSR